MSIELKVKTKHLAEEARIIRFEEKKFTKRLRADIAYNGDSDDSVVRQNENYKTFYNLYSHRVNDVRNEQRASYLARAFLDGKEYKSVENIRNPHKYDIFVGRVIPRVHAMVQKYGSYIDRHNFTIEAIHEWAEVSENYLQEFKRSGKSPF